MLKQDDIIKILKEKNQSETRIKEIEQEIIYLLKDQQIFKNRVKRYKEIILSQNYEMPCSENL